MVKYIPQIPKTSPTNTCSWNQITVGAQEEVDSVFADDGNIEEMNKEQMDDSDTINDKYMTSNPWKEDIKGTTVSTLLFAILLS